MIQHFGDLFRRRPAKSHSQAGLTMIELLLVLVILAVLLILMALWVQSQFSRSRDAQRKADLEKLKVSFEDYYNDKGCYPTYQEYFELQCNSDDFSPYLESFPCDPTTHVRYNYWPAEDACTGYAVLAKLEETSDPSIERVGCEATGCPGHSENYGVAVGYPLSEFTSQPSLPPANACYNGICNFYEDPSAKGCTQISNLPDCGGCGAGESWCEE